MIRGHLSSFFPFLKYLRRQSCSSDFGKLDIHQILLCKLVHLLDQESKNNMAHFNFSQLTMLRKQDIKCNIQKQPFLALHCIAIPLSQNLIKLAPAHTCKMPSIAYSYIYMQDCTFSTWNILFILWCRADI